MNKLFADAGGTKIEWGWVGSDRTIEFRTSGYNPTVSDANYLRQVLISGILGIQAIPVMPSKKNPAHTALRARIPRS